MTVKELIEKLKEVDDNLVVIVETMGIENGEVVDRDELADHIQYNATELYICGEGIGSEDVEW